MIIEKMVIPPFLETKCIALISCLKIIMLAISGVEDSQDFSILPDNFDNLAKHRYRKAMPRQIILILAKGVSHSQC